LYIRTDYWKDRVFAETKREALESRVGRLLSFRSRTSTRAPFASKLSASD